MSRFKTEILFASDKQWLHLLMLALVSFIVYSNTLQVPFVLDDSTNINNFVTNNPRYFLNLPEAFSQAYIPTTMQSAFRTRTVGYLSFAFNLMVTGNGVVGFHLVNIAIHILNSILIYLLLSNILRSPLLSFPAGDYMPSAEHDRRLFSFLCALIFACHPINTQAVTYTVQRFASMATMFYLLALLTYVLYATCDSRDGKRWYLSVSILSVMLGILTKEFVFTFPIMVVACCRMFLGMSWKRAGCAAIPYVAAIMILPARLIMAATTSSAGGASSLGSTLFSMTGNPEIDRYEYMVTQMPVILTYIRLLFFPSGQNLDHDFPLYRSFFQAPVLVSAALLALLAGACLYLFKESVTGNTRFRMEWRLVGFGMLWFGITIAPESFAMPIADVMFEHRLYLPSVGFITALVALLFALRKTCVGSGARLALGGATVVALVALATTCYLRNSVWRTKVTLWEDVVAKSPLKERAHTSLGNAYWEKGRLAEAEREFLTAISLKPNTYSPHASLGNMYGEAGRYDDAIRELTLALKWGINSSQAYNNLGNCYLAKGLAAEAETHYRLAVQYDPANEEARHNLNALRSTSP